MLDYLLTPARCHDWLSSFLPNDAGDPHSPENCPLAQWVRARLWPLALVAHGKVQPQPGKPWEPLPEWACLFESACLDACLPGQSIPAVVALRLLERVTQKENVNA